MSFDCARVTESAVCVSFGALMSPLLCASVCVNQTEQLLFLMATTDNAVNLIIYIERVTDHGSDLGWRHSPYGIASLEG